MRAIVVVALVMVAATLFTPAASQAATPCWQRVLDDWRDGRIDGEYPVHCYRDALSHLPEDLRIYGTAEADIQRALTRELAERSAAHPHTRAVAAKRHSAATSTAAGRRQRRTLAMHSSTQPKAKQPKVRREAAAPPAAADKSSLPVALLLVFGSAAVVGAVALASWRRAAVVRRRRQDV